ncbi:MAG: sigma-70 family RNA polymerase sigma factor [Thermoguttaceae bacterium]|nr:sigma-70 family RNA polymerase sigma factor [Thermoguttaceae bacterium]MDW8038389.1 sigma-70 family RNA polymerase sigma factor [Thermoguttaceae bacterium]
MPQTYFLPEEVLQAYEQLRNGRGCFPKAVFLSGTSFQNAYQTVWQFFRQFVCRTLSKQSFGSKALLAHKGCCPLGKEDICQESLVAFLQNLPLIESPHKLLPYLNKVIYHKICDENRRRYRKKEVRGEQKIRSLPQPGSSALDRLIENEEERKRKTEKEVLEKAIAKLPAHLAECFRMFYMKELTVSQIAQLLGRPEGTVKRWLHECREKIGDLALTLNPEVKESCRG